MSQWRHMTNERMYIFYGHLKTYMYTRLKCISHFETIAASDSPHMEIQRSLPIVILHPVNNRETASIVNVSALCTPLCISAYVHRTNTNAVSRQVPCGPPTATQHTSLTDRSPPDGTVRSANGTRTTARCRHCGWEGHSRVTKHIRNGTGQEVLSCPASTLLTTYVTHLTFFKILSKMSSIYKPLDTNICCPTAAKNKFQSLVSLL